MREEEGVNFATHKGVFSERRVETRNREIQRPWFYFTGFLYVYLYKNPNILYVMGICILYMIIVKEDAMKESD